MVTVKLRERIEPELKRLANETGLSAHVSLLEKGTAIYVLSHDGPHGKTIPWRDKRLPLHASGVGKILAAYLPKDELNQIIGKQRLDQFTDSTITDPIKLREELEVVRIRGYAVDHQEHLKGICCVAVPVKDRYGDGRIALSLSGPTDKFDNKFIQEIAVKLIDVSSKISGLFG
jgi:DNA-binding IclR family transcriptional regulator